MSVHIFYLYPRICPYIPIPYLSMSSYMSMHTYSLSISVPMSIHIFSLPISVHMSVYTFSLPTYILLYVLTYLFPTYIWVYLSVHIFPLPLSAYMSVQTYSPSFERYWIDVVFDQKEKFLSNFPLVNVRGLGRDSTSNWLHLANTY